MGGARAGRLAVASSLLLLLASGCTSPPSDPTPPPTPVAPTPVVNAQEREQRLAYEAAEKSYREFRGEYERVLKAGGSSQPTAAMKRYAGGPYLKETSDVTEAFKSLGYHRVGVEVIVFVRRNGYSPKSLNLRGAARVLLVLGPDWEGYWAGAMFDDVKLGIEHLKAWERFALVSDAAAWIHHVAKVFGVLVPGEVRALGPRGGHGMGYRLMNSGCGARSLRRTGVGGANGVSWFFSIDIPGARPRVNHSQPLRHDYL